MSFLHHIGHHVKHGALSVHGFFTGLLQGTNIGNAIGSLTGAGIGALLAVTGVISGGLVPALIAGVAFGAMVGALAGGAVGSLIGATCEEKQQRNAATPAQTDTAQAEQVERPSPALLQAQEQRQHPDTRITGGTDGFPTQAQPNRPAVLAQDGLSLNAGNRVEPAHYRTKEEGVSFSNRIAQERLAKAVALNSAEASR